MRDGMNPGPAAAVAIARKAVLSKGGNVKPKHMERGGGLS